MPTPTTIASHAAQEFFFRGSRVRLSTGVVKDLNNASSLGKLEKYWRVLSKLSREGDYFDYGRHYDKQVIGITHYESKAYANKIDQLQKNGISAKRSYQRGANDGLHFIQGLDKNYFRGVRGFFRKLREIYFMMFQSLSRKVYKPMVGEAGTAKTLVTEMSTREQKTCSVPRLARAIDKRSREGFSFFMKNTDELPIALNLKDERYFTEDQVLKAFETVRGPALDNAVIDFVGKQYLENPKHFKRDVEAWMIHPSCARREDKLWPGRRPEAARTINSVLSVMSSNGDDYQAAIRKRAISLLGKDRVKTIVREVEQQVRGGSLKLKAKTEKEALIKQQFVTNARIVSDMMNAARRQLVINARPVLPKEVFAHYENMIPANALPGGYAHTRQEWCLY